MHTNLLITQQLIMNIIDLFTPNPKPTFMPKSFPGGRTSMLIKILSTTYRLIENSNALGHIYLLVLAVTAVRSGKTEYNYY